MRFPCYTLYASLKNVLHIRQLSKLQAYPHFMSPKSTHFTDPKKYFFHGTSTSDTPTATRPPTPPMWDKKNSMTRAPGTTHYASTRNTNPHPTHNATQRPRTPLNGGQVYKDICSTCQEHPQNEVRTPIILQASRKASPVTRKDCHPPFSSNLRKYFEQGIGWYSQFQWLWNLNTGRTIDKQTIIEMYLYNLLLKMSNNWYP